MSIISSENGTLYWLVGWLVGWLVRLLLWERQVLSSQCNSVSNWKLNNNTEKSDKTNKIVEDYSSRQKIIEIRMNYLTDKMKRSFFKAAIVLILLYECTTWTLTKRLEKKLDGNYTRTLRAILNKSWMQHPTKQLMYGHLPPITKTIQARRTRHAGHCWRSRDELIGDVLLWTPSHGREKAGWPARTYIQQLCDDTGCSPDDVPEAMNDREGWQERVRDIRVDGTTRWWWPYYFSWLIGLVGRVFSNDPADLRSILGRIIPKTLKMILDTVLLNTQQ